MQIFTRNVNQWAVKPIDQDIAAAFREAVTTANLKLVIAHDSYLINPASQNETLREIDTGTRDRIRTSRSSWDSMGCGASRSRWGQDRTVAVNRAADGIIESLRRTRNLAVAYHRNHSRTRHVSR